MPAHAVAQGNTILQGEGSATVIDCSAFGQRLRLKTLLVTFASIQITSTVEVTDGTTTIFQWQGSAGDLRQPPCLNFPGGYDWGAGNDVIIKVVTPPTKGGYATTVYAVGVAEVRGQA